MSAIDLQTQRDLVKEGQFVVEGNTPATYAITPTNPAFIAAGQDTVLLWENDNVRTPKRLVGNVNRTSVTKTRERHRVRLTTLFMSASEAVLAWGMNSPNGAGTPDESRTFFWSRKMGLAGVETYQTFRGCKPVETTLTINNEGFLVLEILMSCKTVTEDTTGPTIGAGSYATPITGTPVKHDDAVAPAFTYNGTGTEQRGFVIRVTLTEAVQDSSGSLFDSYRRPTIRAISGSVDIFKIGTTIQADSIAVTQRAASLVVVTASITLTFTRFLAMPSAEALTGDKSDATIERKDYEADDLVVA